MEEADQYEELQPIEEPVEHYGHRCREVVALAMRAFLDLLDAAAGDEDKVPVETVRRIALAVMGAEGALANYYDLHSAGCAAFFELSKIERKRTDFFGRMITEPLVPLLDDPASGIGRNNLPQLFDALKMILGDDVYTDYNNRCIRIANELRVDGEMFPWERFYSDERVRQIFEATLVAVARSFKRFGPRKDWFLIVMNNDPQAVSLGANMFVQKKSEEKRDHGFGVPNFVRLFRSLFASVRPSDFDGQRRRRFAATYGATPEVIFGGLFVALTDLEQCMVAVAPRRGSGTGIELRKKCKAKK